MLEDFEYDALTLRAPPQRTRWYTRLWPACLGHGCFGRKRQQQFTLYLIGYDPVGELHRAASVGDVASVERLINGSEHHVNESDRRGRHSENPAIPSSLADDKGNTSAIKDEGCNLDSIFPEPPKDGILPQPPTEIEITTTSGEPTGPRRIPPPKPPRTKRQAPQKPPLSPTLQPRNNTPGLLRSLCLLLLCCVPARPPHQDEGSNLDSIRPDNPEYGILPQPPTEIEITTTSGEPTGPRRIPAPKPPRTKRQAPQKPPLSPSLEPRNNTPGPPVSVIPPLPSCVPARPPHQDEGSNLDSIRPDNPEYGILPQPPTEIEITTTSGEPTGPRRIPAPKPRRTKRQAPQKPPLSPSLEPRNNTPGPPVSVIPPLPPCVPARPPHQDEGSNLNSIRPDNPEDGILPQPPTEIEITTTSGEPTGPRRIPPPKPPRTKRQAPQKPPLSPSLEPRNNTPGPPVSVIPPLPSCVPARPPHQDEGSNLDSIRPDNPEDGILPQPPTEIEITTTSGEPTGPRRIPAPKPPRTKRQAPQKPPLSPSLEPRNNTPGPPVSVIPPLPPCVPARPPHQDEGSNLNSIRPDNPEDGILPQPPTEIEITTTSGEPTGPRRIPPPKPPRTKRQAPQKPPLSPSLEPRNNTPGPPVSVIPPLPSCVPARPPHQDEGSNLDSIRPDNPEDGTLPQPPTEIEITTTSGEGDRRTNRTTSYSSTKATSDQEAGTTKASSVSKSGTSEQYSRTTSVRNSTSSFLCASTATSPADRDPAVNLPSTAASVWTEETGKRRTWPSCTLQLVTPTLQWQEGGVCSKPMSSSGTSSSLTISGTSIYWETAPQALTIGSNETMGTTRAGLPPQGKVFAHWAGPRNPFTMGPLPTTPDAATSIDSTPLRCQAASLALALAPGPLCC
ncbi:hypothetical protein LEMLEM_LOCUS25858 [Lemmus lemmus]